MSLSSPLLNTAIKIIYMIANSMQQFSRNMSSVKLDKNSTNQDINTLITAINDTALTMIVKSYPSHNVITKNYLNSNFNIKNMSDNYTWIINPLIGIDNFIHNNPFYGIAITIILNNKITHSIILDTTRNDLYKSEVGKGAFINEKRIRVSNNNLENALMIVNDQCDLHLLQELRTKKISYHINGANALNMAYLAKGAFDGFYDKSCDFYDLIAGILLIQESGGFINNITTPNYNFSNMIISTINHTSINTQANEVNQAQHQQIIINHIDNKLMQSNIIIASNNKLIHQLSTLMCPK